MDLAQLPCAILPHRLALNLFKLSFVNGPFHRSFMSSCTFFGVVLSCDAQHRLRSKIDMDRITFMSQYSLHLQVTMLTALNEDC